VQRIGGAGRDAGTARARVEDPVQGAGQQHGAERPAQCGGAESDVLEARGEDDERDDRTDEAVRCPRGYERAHEDGRDAADDDGRRDGELDVPEGQRAQRGGQGEGYGLREVGADELVRPEHRVEEEQQHDHQRTGADRGHADDEAADHPDGDRRERTDGDVGDDAVAALARPLVEEHPQCHRGRPHEQRGAEDGLHVALRALGVAEQMERPRAEQRGGHRPDDHVADEPVVDRLLRHVHGGADGAHEHGGDEVARDGGRRLDVEEEDEHRRHERPAARAGHPDQEAHEGAAQDDVGVNRHLGLPRDGRRSPSTHRYSLFDINDVSSQESWAGRKLL
jgi:hypothetical protein